MSYLKKVLLLMVELLEAWLGLIYPWFLLSGLSMDGSSDVDNTYALTKFPPEHVVNSETHPMINHFHSKSFTDARLLTIPFYLQWAEHTLNKMKCAQTQVVKDTYLFIGLFMGKAMAATLINKPQNFSDLPQWNYISFM